MKIKALLCLGVVPAVALAIPTHNPVITDRAEVSTPATVQPAISAEVPTIAKEASPSIHDSIYLDEVVVAAQGASIQRRRLSTKVEKVTSEDMKGLPTARLDQMLQNALPNVQISLTGGQPGTTSLIKSRGLSSAFSNSTPVIYVDGVRVDNLNTGSHIGASHHGYSAEPYGLSDLPMGETAASSSISDIPMENIDHIEYLTGGAATTLYGSDAANGVILITTKKSGEGRFHASVGMQAGVEAATTQFYHFKRTKDLLNQTGFYQKYQLNMDGSNGRFGYSLGASMSHGAGSLIHNGNENRKYDLHFGSQINITPQLDYQNSFGLVVEDFKRRRNGNQGLYTALWTTECSAAADLRYTGADGALHNFNPDIDAMDAQEYGKFKALVDRAENLQDNNENVKRFQTSHTVIYKPMKNLAVRGVLGVDYRTNNFKEIITNEYLIHTQVKPEGTSDAGRIFNSDRNYFGLTLNLNAEYKLYHSDWLSNIATAGFQFFSTDDHQVMYNGTNVNDGARVMSGAGSINADEWLSHINSYGFYVQDNFGIRNRYYLDLGMRIDRNSAFGDNVGWQCYPKIGLSYVMSEEPFMMSLKEKGIVNNVRFLANYGVAGNYPPAFEYQRTISIVPFKGKQSATFGKYGNPDLGPEKKHSIEAGFDVSMFNHILGLGVTYYYARTKDALFSVPTLPSTGEVSHYLANIGEIENKGVEITLGITPVQTQDWNVRFLSSFNTNHNKVLSTGGLLPFGIGGFSARTIETAVQEGKPIGFLRGAKAIANENGTFKESLPLQDLGSTLPTFYGNFSLVAGYKKWQIHLNGDYQTGAHVHSFDRQFRFRKGLKDNAIPETMLQGLNQGKVWLDFTNYFVEKADFIKIRNIGIDHTFTLCKKRSTQLLVAFNVYNPLSFTSSVVDPEASLSGSRQQGAVATSGINYATFSNPRQFIFSIKLDF